MTRPDDITEEAWEAAGEVAVSHFAWIDECWPQTALRLPRPAVPEGLKHAIARAIMAAEQRGAERERERCAAMLDEGYDRELGEAYRSDGAPSKNDKCAHDLYMWEECLPCAVVAIRAAFSPDTQER